MNGREVAVLLELDDNCGGFVFVKMRRWRAYGGVLPDLALHANLREGDHCSSGTRYAHRSSRTESGEDQHVFHRMRNIAYFVRAGEDPIVLDPAVGVHVGFDHQRVFGDGAQGHTETRLL